MEIRHKIRDLVAPGIGENYARFLDRSYDIASLPPVNAADPVGVAGLELEDLHVPDGMFLFNGRQVLTRQLPKDLQGAETMVDINRLKKHLSDIKDPRLSQLEDIEFIKAKLAPDGKVVANRPLFSCLSQDMKAKVTAIFTLNKFYRPLIKNDDDFFRLRDEMIHTKDYIAAKILNMDEDSKAYKGLSPLKFTGAKTVLELHAERDGFFAEQRPGSVYDDPDNVEFVVRYLDQNTYYNFIKLNSVEALDYEGEKMGHCVGSGGYDSGLNKDIFIYSLRDKNGEPHATIEIGKDKSIRQIQGKGDKAIIAKYHEPCRWFLESQGISPTYGFYAKIPCVTFPDGGEKAVAGLRDADIDEMMKNPRGYSFKPQCELLSDVLQGKPLTYGRKLGSAAYLPPLLERFLPRSETRHTLTSLDASFLGADDELAKTLAQCQMLTTLNLGLNWIGPEGAQALAQSRTLISLDLTGNAIGREGAKALAQSQSLTILDLEDNNIGDEGAKALAQNTILTKLDLKCNHISLDGIKALAQNRTLTSLELDGNSIGKEGILAFNEAFNQGNCNLIYLTPCIDDETFSYLERNRQEAGKVLDLILSGKKVQKDRITPRKNAILAIAKEREGVDMKALEASIAKYTDAVPPAPIGRLSKWRN